MKGGGARVAVIEDEVAAIARALDAPGGGGRGEAAARLTELRARYRARPADFSPDLVDRLKALADSLRRPPPRPAPTLDAARAVLRELFGHDDFRPGQAAIVEAVLAGRDCLGVMPTGAGKSLTYQLPARLLGGTTLVISPLIALMKDQVDAMSRAGLRATFLNSTLAPEERRARVAALRRGEVELLYAAPEGLEASVGQRALRAGAVAAGRGRGPLHQPLGPRLPPRLPAAGRPEGPLRRAGAGAHRHRHARGDARHRRPARHGGAAAGDRLLPADQPEAPRRQEGRATARRRATPSCGWSRRGGGRAASSTRWARKTVESVAEFLADHGVRAAAYHAGLEAAERERVQDAFAAGAVEVVVATIAFGMGIDKADIRYVIHRDMPRSLEAYYQEIGRAGRDGLDSDCVLFYSWADVAALDRMAGDDEQFAAMQRRQARAMFRFADEPGCRHERLVGHFGEVAEPCGDACDACGLEPPVTSSSTASRSRRAPSGRTPRRRRPSRRG